MKLTAVRYNETAKIIDSTVQRLQFDASAQVKSADIVILAVQLGESGTPPYRNIRQVVIAYMEFSERLASIDVDFCKRVAGEIGLLKQRTVTEVNFSKFIFGCADADKRLATRSARTKNRPRVQSHSVRPYPKGNKNIHTVSVLPMIAIGKSLADCFPEIFDVYTFAP